MEELSIRVHIANRTYPLTVQSSEEEQVRAAAKLINDKLRHLQQLFEVKDIQDNLAMVSLELANELIQAKKDIDMEKERLIQEIHQILDVLEPVSL